MMTLITRKQGAQEMCDHLWLVLSAALCPPTIMVQCAHCDQLGYVEDWTTKEWRAAFFTPSWSYKWEGKGRVKLYDEEGAERDDKVHSM